VDSERKLSTCMSDILVVDWLSTQPCVACCFSTVSRRPRLLGGQFSSPIAYLPILSRKLNKYKAWDGISCVAGTWREPHWVLVM
jgi:hypothetical protein